MDKKTTTSFSALLVAALFVAGTSCQSPSGSGQAGENDSTTGKSDTGRPKYLAPPLISEVYTADPSAHVFENRIYIYPSHDIDAGIPQNDNGDHFAMRDYHIFSMDSIGGKVTNHGVGQTIIKTTQNWHSHRRMQPTMKLVF